VNHKTGVLILLGLAFMLAGCGDSAPKRVDVLARAGSHELTRADFEAMAGASFDSLSSDVRWALINNWVENAVVLQEGDRKHLDQDASIESQINTIRAELYLSKLLAEGEEKPPSDSEIETYFEQHRSEFILTADSYLLELYHAATCDSLLSFQAHFNPADPITVESEVVLEQRWLASADELSGYLGSLLSQMSPGAWTDMQQDADGCRVLRLAKTYPAGAALDLDGAREEIKMQLMIESNHQRREDLMTDLRQRFPVAIFVEDSL
jgi:hypothetical protein